MFLQAIEVMIEPDIELVMIRITYNCEESLKTTRRVLGFNRVRVCREICHAEVTDKKACRKRLESLDSGAGGEYYALGVDYVRGMITYWATGEPESIRQKKGLKIDFSTSKTSKPPKKV